jgi:hypothetical protein
MLCVLLVMATTACGPRELRITMNSDNNSGQTGFAVLVDRGNRGMTVTVETSAPDFNELPQDAHVHEGDCGEVGATRATLTPLAAVPNAPDRYGSTTEVGGLTFAMLSTGQWIINVHDARDDGIYVSCGEIPAP